MVAVAVGVHAYLALMTALIGVSAALTAVARGDVRLPTLLMQGLAAAAVLLGLAWLLGYFAGTAQVSTHGHGLYSANLLTWVDPMAWNDFMRLHQRQAPYVGEWSRWLPARDQATGGQYEGYAWLGTGMLALVAVATVAAFGAAVARFLPLGRPSISKPYTTALGRPASLPWGLLLVCSLLALWALSARITFGAHTLVEFDPPPIVDTLLGVFRASGRFIWPLTYLLMAWAIVQVAMLGGAGRPKWGPALVAAALVLQAWDTSPKWLEFHSRFRLGPPGVVSRVQDPRWAEWLQRCPRLEWVADEAPETPPGRWIGPTLAAGLAGAHVLPAPTSHPSPEVQAQRRAHLQALVQGAWRPDTVYVFPGDAPAQPPTHLSTTTLDGYATLAAPACRGTER
jgi:hypothetical protein